MIDIINKVIVENWNKVNPGEKIKKHFRYLLIHGYNNVIIFVFSKNKKFPCVVVKIDRFSRGSIVKEYRIFVELEKTPFIKDTVPTPLGYFSNSDGEFIIQTALKGECLSHSKLLFRRKALNSVFRIVTNWLIGLQFWQKERNSFTADDVVISELYKDIEDAAREDKKKLGIFSCYESRLRSLFDKIKGEHIPFVLQHGDFWPGNILLDNNKIGVVDWDKAVESGFPLCDMIEFSLHCSHLLYSPFIERYCMNAACIDTYAHNAFFNKGIQRLVAKYINEYCRALKINMEITKVIFLWYLIKKYENLDIMELFFLNEKKFLKIK